METGRSVMQQDCSLKQSHAYRVSLTASRLRRAYELSRVP
jgi:hypothetical protein